MTLASLLEGKMKGEAIMTLKKKQLEETKRKSQGMSGFHQRRQGFEPILFTVGKIILNFCGEETEFVGSQTARHFPDRFWPCFTKSPESILPHHLGHEFD